MKPREQMTPGRRVRHLFELQKFEGYLYLKRGIGDLSMAKQVLGAQPRKLLSRYWSLQDAGDDDDADRAVQDGARMREALAFLQHLIEVYETMRGYPRWSAPAPADRPPTEVFAGPVTTAFFHWLRATGGLYGKLSAEATIRTYGEHLKLFWRFCERHGGTPLTADRDLCERYFDLRRRDSSTTRDLDLQALRQFYAWLVREGRRQDDPSSEIRVKRLTSVPTRPQSDQELEMLVRVCGLERDKLIVMLLAATGVRASELAAMRVEDVDWLSGSIKVHGKGAHERLVQLPADVLERLRLFAGNVDSTGQPWPRTGPVWRSLHYPYADLDAKQLRKLLYRLGERAGVKVAPHRLRASFAVNFIKQFGDIHALAARMGHADLNTTALYLKWLSEERGLAMQARLEISRILADQAWRREALPPQPAEDRPA